MGADDTTDRVVTGQAEEFDMAYDFKKEYKELYAPKKGPGIIEVPPITYVAVRGKVMPSAACRA